MLTYKQNYLVTNIYLYYIYSAILCDLLNFCFDDVRYMHWGIQKIPNTHNWMYMNGTTASDEDILWINANQPSFSDRDCGAIKTETPRSGQDHLEALSGDCAIDRYALCQFRC